MSKFDLFDSVSSTAEIPLSDGGFAPPGTPGAIVEIFKDGEAYLVELFGGWVKAEVGGDFVAASQDDPDSFMETLGIETVYPYQLQLEKSARKIGGIRKHLASILENLSDDLVLEVCNFAEFLQQKQQKQVS